MPLSVQPRARARGQGPKGGSASRRGSRARASSPRAETAPTASRETRKSSTTSQRRAPPLLRARPRPSCTHSPTRRVRSPVPHRGPVPADAQAQVRGSREQRAGTPGTRTPVYLHAVQFDQGRLPFSGRAGAHTHQVTSRPETHRRMGDIELHGRLGTSSRDVLWPTDTGEHCQHDCHCFPWLRNMPRTRLCPNSTRELSGPHP